MDPWIGVVLTIAFPFSFPLPVTDAKALNIGFVSFVVEGGMIALFTVAEGPVLFASIWVAGWNEGCVL